MFHANPHARIRSLTAHQPGVELALEDFGERSPFHPEGALDELGRLEPHGHGVAAAKGRARAAAAGPAVIVDVLLV